MLKAMLGAVLLAATVLAAADASGAGDGQHHRYIVQFRDYAPAAHHRRRLLLAVNVTASTIQRRRQTLLRAPTDFVVVNVPPRRAATLRRLRALPFVRRVVRDRRVALAPAQANADDGLASCASHATTATNGYGGGTAPAFALGADVLWRRGVNGSAVKIAVLDTGGPRGARRAADFTDELAAKADSAAAGRGGHHHGAAVAALISGVAGGSDACPGMAPGAILFHFKVFTIEGQVSYTSFFLDALNLALAERVDIVNLSVGGPDSGDLPFLEKVRELTAQGILMVSAIGNDGFMGSANSPGDMVCVLGVGGYAPRTAVLASRTSSLQASAAAPPKPAAAFVRASYSSRGMTTWRGEVPAGAGRVKPELLAPSHRLLSGTGDDGAGCTLMSGTSVASPVVAGAVALLASALPPSVSNPAFLKQLLLESGERLGDGSTMFEQGSGRLNLLGAFRRLQAVRDAPPRATLFPAVVDMTARGCPYFWPYCAQPLYAGMLNPLQLNVTILNAVGVLGHVVDGGPRVVDERVSVGGVALPSGTGKLTSPLLRIAFTTSDVVWPYHGWMALAITVDAGAAAALLASAAATEELTVDATVAVTVATVPPARARARRRAAAAGRPRRSTATLKLRATVVPTPPRAKRVAWDTAHSLHYPPQYVPRDDLRVDNDLLDWHGDHPWTNFHKAHRALREAGYFVEIVGRRWGPATLSADAYGALLVVDPERDFEAGERRHLVREVSRGLSVVIFADWYHEPTMERIQFFDENTHEWWSPVTGGANVPAVNALLRPWNISLDTSRVLAGRYALVGAPSLRARFASGAGIAAFPGRVAYARGVAPQVVQQQGGLGGGGGGKNSQVNKEPVPVLGFFNTAASASSGKTPGAAAAAAAAGGRIVLYGDSNCIDASHLDGPCWWLLDAAMVYATRGEVGEVMRGALREWRGK